jgi:hypothetical protein
MEFKYFLIQNPGHVSGACKQNDRDHEIGRHGSDHGDIPPWQGVAGLLLYYLGE